MPRWHPHTMSCHLLMKGVMLCSLKILSCCRKPLEAVVWSPTQKVAEATEGERVSRQFAEVKAIQLALETAEEEEWPVLSTLEVTRAKLGAEGRASRLPCNRQLQVSFAFPKNILVQHRQ